MAVDDTREADWDPARDRIGGLTLEEANAPARSAAVEHERRVALHDLLEANRFRPVMPAGLAARQPGADVADGASAESPPPGRGPFTVRVAIADGRRLRFAIAGADGRPLREIILALSPLRRLIRDYFHICDSYYDAIKRLPPARIEAVDMARRGLHDEGAEALRERLDGKAEMDAATARRLFTLICVLHMRS